MRECSNYGRASAGRVAAVLGVWEVGLAHPVALAQAVALARTRSVDSDFRGSDPDGCSRVRQDKRGVAVSDLTRPVPAGAAVPTDNRPVAAIQGGVPASNVPATRGAAGVATSGWADFDTTGMGEVPAR